MQSTEDYYCNQENEEDSGGFQSGAINRLAMLTLKNNSTFPTTTTTTGLPIPSSAPNRCTTCGSSSSSVKRRSSSSSSLQEPSAKKQLLTLLTPPPSSSAPATDTTNLSPPINTQVTPPSAVPILRRCISDPVKSPGTTQFLNPRSPGNEKTTVSSMTPSTTKGTVSLPPVPRVFRRSISDPLSHSPNSGELGSESNRGGESPSSKTLKRMKDRMREMIQWWDQVMHEEENNNGHGNFNSSITTEDKIPVTETEEVETQEAVSVERTGECLVIHFECPCKKGYQILLSGNNCYYKLM